MQRTVLSNHPLMGVMGINMGGFALSRCSWLQTGMLSVCAKDIS